MTDPMPPPPTPWEQAPPPPPLPPPPPARPPVPAYPPPSSSYSSPQWAAQQSAGRQWADQQWGAQQPLPPLGFPGAPYAPARNNGLAIASMVVGIVGILLFWIYAIPPIVAVVLGHVALGQIKRKHQAGKGMAIAGIVTGYAGIAFAVIVFAAALASST